MNKFFRLLACAALLASASVAKAGVYDYAYTFSDGSLVSGSFQGSANGNLITDLSNFSVFINGEAFASNGQLLIRDISGNGTGVVSFDGKQTSLLVLNSFALDVFSHVLLLGAFQGSAITNVINYVTPLQANAEGPGITPYSSANWHVTAVPEPATSAMLLAGLALVGAAARRRKTTGPTRQPAPIVQ